MEKHPPHHSFRAQLYLVMEGARQGYHPAKVFDAFLFFLIFVSIGFGVWSTVPAAPNWVDAWFPTIEAAALTIFTIEYLLRLWVCVEEPHHRYSHPVKGRLRFALTPLMLIDLIVLLPFYLSFIGYITPELLLVLRILRVAKLFRTVTAFETIARVIWNERQALMAVGLLIVAVLLVVSTLAYIAEHDAQPDKFSSIPAAAYWAIITLTTVGYGDLTPVTAMGQLLAGATTILGILTLALPSAIIVSGFVEELKRRDLSVTWNLVAAMPLFARLSIAEVARIAALLKLQRVEAGEIIIRKGDTADAMYFIATGEIELQLPADKIVLNDGDFFGEFGLLEGGERSATATARTASDLLILEAAEFQQVLREFPDIKQKVHMAVKERHQENQQTAVEDED